MLQRIANDTNNPTLSIELHDAIRNRMAFLFVRGDDGFVLKPLAEDGVIGALVWVGWGDGGAPAGSEAPGTPAAFPLSA